MIIPTLAYQLAHPRDPREDRELRSELALLFRSDPDVIHRPPCDQMKTLIIRPLKNTQTRGTVIVIDALDKCDGGPLISDFLSLLETFEEDIRELKLKFFITGRPENVIQEGFSRIVPLEVALHEVEPSEVRQDIRRYFEHELSKPGILWEVGSGPSSLDLEKLSELAGGLFCYAAEAVKFISAGSGGPRQSLARLLQKPEKIGPYSSYTSILNKAFNHNSAEDVEFLRSVLTHVVIKHPISPHDIAEELGVDVQVARSCLGLFQSVLIFQEDNRAQPFHWTFRAFLTNRHLCKDKRFYLNHLNDTVAPERLLL